MWSLKNLVDHAMSCQAEIGDKWVPARPENFKRGIYPLLRRLRDAWEVFMCRAEAFKWPEGQ